LWLCIVAERDTGMNGGPSLVALIYAEDHDAADGVRQSSDDCGEHPAFGVCTP
jgi:hypothetical protein